MSRAPFTPKNPKIVYESPKGPYNILNPPIRVIKYQRDDGSAASLVEELRKTDADAFGKSVDYWRACGSRAEQVLFEICERLAAVEK